MFSDRRNTTRWLIILVSFLIISLILWNTYTFFQIFKNEERLKMNLWAKAQKTLINADANADVELPLQIFSTNSSIPIILTENNKIINAVNIDEKIIASTSESAHFLEDLKNENDPIVIQYAPGKFQKLYYGNSALLNKLKYYPIALVLIIVLFAALVYNFYRSTKMATQNKLWAGMAKETAHQIGTPLSSLIGWIELLKAENVAESTTQEIEKDIERLQTITDRFSKIGSEPKLENQNIIAATQETIDYLQSRFSKQVLFSFQAPELPIFVLFNATLHSWTIENLVKNAIDAMKGKGNLDLVMEQEGEWIQIKVSDTGIGIPKKQFKTIFEPGFTTKKRGWGLGLSLTKRIVEEYHKGRIKVVQSEIGKGSTIQLSYKKSESI
ncbi:HAMP domain-containing sensor histidine kinase [Flavobacterium sp.]|uniref:sensor histidine kinase n=1 Tax=Flavobacterium sp. TaxID=239 RepID=UPI0008CC2165|nr:HAMP domain-containing sensor histidine kinase [Flavobacterium sp.]OGS65384.1 MAG: two-component sensor histidine kinase [Flavobacteria bacterium GWA2_35_26]HCF03726.1 two-component sensor histidine kinase [Flavobacterium sp.]